MSYEPKEGIDYIVNLYAVADAPMDAASEDIKRSINTRLKEYHPDRLQTVAPEFRAKGERMAALLNRAKHILLDDNRRAEYDDILGSWDGPLSEDGTPVITMTRHIQMEMAEKTPEEIEAAFTEQAVQIAGMTGYSPNRLKFLESMIAQSDTEVDEALRNEYEDALLQQDRNLALQEAERSRLLGMPDIASQRYAATIGYSGAITEKIDQTRIARLEQIKLEALGGVTTRLALLAGDGEPVTPGAVIPADASLDLPHYFEAQATKIEEIAKVRESITEKRLQNFTPHYPEADMQTDFKPDVLVGIGGLAWFGIAVDREAFTAESFDVPDSIRQLLDAEDFRTVIGQNFNVLTFDPLEQLDIHDMLNAAIEKYITKYESD